MLKRITHELVEHIPFTALGAVAGIIVMVIIHFSNTPREISESIFYTLHPLHIVLSALATAAIHGLTHRASPVHRAVHIDKPIHRSGFPIHPAYAVFLKWRVRAKIDMIGGKQKLHGSGVLSVRKRFFQRLEFVSCDPHGRFMILIAGGHPDPVLIWIPEHAVDMPYSPRGEAIGHIPGTRPIP